MASHDAEHLQDKKQLLIEDFIATRPQIQIGQGEDRWDCTAELRGSTIWITPKEPLPVEAGAEVDLFCPHATGTYRFGIDIVEAEPDRLIATRSIKDPMGWRASVRGRIRIPVVLTPIEGADTKERAGHTVDLCRSGTLVTMRDTMAVGSTWQCDLTLSSDHAVRVDASVIRTADLSADNGLHHYGLHFVTPPADVQRQLFDFVMSHTDISQIPSTSE